MTGGQVLGAGNNANRGSATLPSDVPLLLQCLPLESVTLGNQKYTRSGELRRVLGVPLASATEDHSFGTANPKPPPPVAYEELKHFKESVQNACRKARDRAKLFRESLYKLERYKETATSKKRQRSDLTLNERSNGVNVPKPGNHVQRGPHDITSPRLEDKDKAVGTNKRARTLVSESWADGRSNVAPRQPMVLEKNDDLHQDLGGGSFRIEEKIRRLPAGGEGWELKNKKKRSVGAVGSRGINGDPELKRSMHPKMSTESKLRASDHQGLRSKASPGVGILSKLESSLDHTSSDTTSTMIRSESENASPPVDKVAVLEQKNGRKGSNKQNFPKDAISNRPSTSTKPKVSRAPRTGSIMLLDSSLKVSLSSTSLQGSEQPANNNKAPNLGVANDHKRQASAGSPSHPMAQWVGQRPHKSSRMRRANVVAPVSDNDEAGISSPNLSTPELNNRTLHFGTNGSPASNGVDNTLPKFKRELESSGSPFGLSESEESGAGGNKPTYKGRDNGDFAQSPTQKVGALLPLTRKNKLPAPEIADGIRKGRNGKASLVGRPAIHPVKEKQAPSSKPLQHLKSGSDKNKSKTGRPPSRKLKDRKPSSRVGSVPHSGSLDLTGESDDDHEELIAAAKAARNAKNSACSSPFWKKMESVFSSVGSKDISYLKQQLEFAEELEDSFSEMLGIECSIVVEGSNQEPERTSLFGSIEVGRSDKGCSLYQRVLSAIIEEDDGEELFIHSEGKNISLQYASDDSHCGSCNLIDIDPRDRDKVESEAESNVYFQSQKIGFMDRNSSDKSVSSNSIKDSSMSSSLNSNGYWLGDNDASHSDIWHTGEICSNDHSYPRDPNGSGFYVPDQQYHLLSLDDRLMLELQSIGLCPESLPDLAEEDIINQDIMELKGGLHQQIGRKKRRLEKLFNALHLDADVEKRKIEQVAMDQLIEIAYRRRLACRGNHSSKTSARKVSGQSALSFIKRTLARCRKFEETGSNCFSEPALQELIFSTPCNNDAKSADGVGSGTASNTCHEVVEAGLACVSGCKLLSPGVGVSPSDRYNGRGGSHDRSKRKEVLIDEVIGSASSRVTSNPECNALGEVRDKRSDRDRDQNKVNSRSVSVSAVSGPSSGDFRNESKTKTKPKQRVNGPLAPVSAAIGPNNKTDQDAASLQDMFNEAGVAGLPIPDLESFGLESNEQQDLDFFSNIDDDGHDIIGLEIPMDDLSDIF